MVRPSAETLARPLTDAQSISAGDGTDVGDDGVDIDDGAGGIATPPIAEVVEVVAASGSAVELDFNVASWWDITLTANCTLTIVNPPASGLVGLLTIILRQGGSGSYTVTWPGTVEWPDTDGTDGGGTPTLWTAVGARDVIQVITEDGGTSYGGSYDGGTGSGGTPATTVTDETTFGITPAVGTDTEYARQDHTHGSPANPVSEAGVRDIGHWEVVVSGSAPPVAVSTPADDDWVYAWVPG